MSWPCRDAGLRLFHEQPQPSASPLAGNRFLMQITTYCQCACANCGRIIDYRTSQAGEIIRCPACGENSVLPQPEKLSLVEKSGPPIPEFRECPVCHAQIKFYAPTCASCETRRKRNHLLVAAFALILIILAVAIAIPMAKKHRSKTISDETAAAGKPSVPTPRILIEAPRAKAPKSMNDLVPRRFALEKRRGSDLTLALGDIDNVSENSHHQLRANLDLFDLKGVKIGTVSDYCTQLGPYQSWHLVATVSDTNVASLRFAGIEEKP